MLRVTKRVFATAQVQLRGSRRLRGRVRLLDPERRGAVGKRQHERASRVVGPRRFGEHHRCANDGGRPPRRGICRAGSRKVSHDGPVFHRKQLRAHRDVPAAGPRRGSHRRQLRGQDPVAAIGSLCCGQCSVEQYRNGNVDGLADFLQATGWKVIYGLNLKTATPQSDAAEATCGRETRHESLRVRARQRARSLWPDIRSLVGELGRGGHCGAQRAPGRAARGPGDRRRWRVRGGGVCARRGEPAGAADPALLPGQRRHDEPDGCRDVAASLPQSRVGLDAEGALDRRNVEQPSRWVPPCRGELVLRPWGTRGE